MSISTASKVAHQLRIIAVPLTRPNPRSYLPLASAYGSTGSSSTTKPTAETEAGENRDAKRILTYYQFQLSRPLTLTESTTGSKGKGILSRWLPEGGVGRWASKKATDTWAGWGNAKEGSWKLWAYQKGEQFVDRIDFEELALKGIDPSLGPSVLRPNISGKENPKLLPVSIPLVFPPSILSGSATLNNLRFLVEQRIPKHKRGFIIWAMIAPLTAPLKLIPIIPNLPFFFCVWRSWSHYRAYRASQYLQSLLSHGSIVPEESHSLDTIYKDYHPSSSPTGQEMLLSKDAVPALVSIFGLKGSADAELCRALEQARLRAEGKK